MARVREPVSETAPNEGGFVLLDAVIGAVLIAAALMAAAQLVLDVNNLRHTVEVKRLVLNTLDDQLKEVQVTPFQDIEATHNGRSFPVTQDGGLDLQPPQGDPDGMPGLIVVQPVTDESGAPDSELIEVVVSVEWMDRTGRRSLERTLRISRVGGIQ